jgi:hypothetical protein
MHQTDRVAFWSERTGRALVGEPPQCDRDTHGEQPDRHHKHDATHLETAHRVHALVRPD